MKNAVKWLLFLGLFVFILGLFIYWLAYWEPPVEQDPVNAQGPDKVTLSKGWAILSGGRKGKVVFAQPPHLYVLDLEKGTMKQVPRVVVDGAKGRRNRGKSPRPSWAPDGKQFVYRYNSHVFVCNEEGKRKAILNELMDCSNETRWSWRRENGEDWLVGPSKDRNVIMVKVDDPTVVKTPYNGGDVDKHCEITGEGHVVYDNGDDIFVTPAYSGSKGIKISKGQSCRPCASPENRVAWLPVPHVKYEVHDAVTGRELEPLEAPKREEIYRLNWSNLPDFAVHMYGSRGNTRMHVRKVSTGEALFIGYGWDPDLWVE